MEVSAIQLTHKEFSSISQNYEGAAATVGLLYARIMLRVLNRIEKGTGFTYPHRKQKLTDITKDADEGAASCRALDKIYKKLAK